MTGSAADIPRRMRYNANPMAAKDSLHAIAVIGAGRWGGAVAIFLAERGCAVRLWAREPEVAEEIRARRTNPFLPGFRFPDAVAATDRLAEAVAGADLIALAVPVQFLRAVLKELAPLDSSCPILGINKGIEQGTCAIVPEIVREELGPRPYAHLGGPCFPEGLLNPRTPVAETVASDDPALARAIQDLFAWRNFRPYRSADVRGVAVLGAMKNVYAIAAGAAAGLGLGQESVAVLVTRALAELRALTRAMGIPETTVQGLSGLGDLILTCYSPASSHNRRLGVALGEGAPLDRVLAALGPRIAEGYYTAACVHELARRYEVEMPIATGVRRVLYEGAAVKDILTEWMQRPLKSEA
ncbi:MAG: Glycerol-3-phosphate dehydrogenase (NAD(P)+) [Planctomycetes bacterium ADurb.Bin069]|nr:MAG: Glycerol-3-phosphate dehydrogenase (NAD(P)+) [Planctomycetes bacterium ADurb.Bin069]